MSHGIVRWKVCIDTQESNARRGMEGMFRYHVQIASLVQIHALPFDVLCKFRSESHAFPCMAGCFPHARGMHEDVCRVGLVKKSNIFVETIAHLHRCDLGMGSMCHEVWKEEIRMKIALDGYGLRS